MFLLVGSLYETHFAAHFELVYDFEFLSYALKAFFYLVLASTILKFCLLNPVENFIFDIF